MPGANAQQNMEEFIKSSNGSRRWFGRKIDFATVNLPAGGQLSYTIKLGNNYDLFFDSMVCDVVFNSDKDPRTQESEILVQIYDSRNAIKWFYPLAIPLSLAFGQFGAFQQIPSSYYYVPRSNDLILEFTNNTASAYSTALNVLFGCVQAF